MKRRARHILSTALAAGLIAFTPQGATNAQAVPATLIADDIQFDNVGQAITARGGVEVFWEGTRLRAEAITYSSGGDRITVEGPITLIDPSGGAIILADFAELSADLQEGVLQSARLVLDRQMQIAATQIDRSDGRYTQMYQAVASSCEVCADNPTPLWEIRARRVIHDAEEQQLYFEGAQFRVIGVPVMYLPQMRLPDPTLDRASGFLAPSIRSDDVTGTQLRVPYFIMLGDHADVTVTPWLGTGDSQTVELRYRQAFRNGRVTATGALTADDLTNDDFRGYLFSYGRFDLPRDLTLDFAVETVSDEGYLTTYDFPDPDLLESYLRVSRVTADSYLEVGATLYNSLRDGVNNDELPTQVVQGSYTHRFTPDLIGGIAQVNLEAMAYARPSDAIGFDAVTGDPLGTDVARLTAGIDWQRSTILPAGLLLTYEAALFADLYSVREDPDFNGETTRITPYGQVELRWPLQRLSQGGVSHLIEPVVQLGWSRTSGDPVPVEDSAIVEFDEANLFALDRYPGSDRREEGTRANLGVIYTRTDPLGWSAGVTAGLVLREEEINPFTAGSGLDGVQSDWLFAAHVGVDDRWRLINRAIFNSDFDFTSNEMALTWGNEEYDLSSSYIWLAADIDEGRVEDLSEWAFDASYRIDDFWQAGVDWRYDFVEDEPSRTGLSIGYANECVDVEFTVSRRYTNASTLEPTTSFGLTVALNGFGATREGRSQARSCRQ
ncbi:Outer membrane protein Imp [Roseibacterium elongatum DSM 19469]|uniref:LPS-assembly protein LptD n=1 Tax=Roseicyclus elongatus DSM 19469 TaxID=1294273 RepID=W8RWC1_9RHOB|nr:LPS assembly protein LptD [Roseibacterium elongatum]AHM05469.1 Outer membrane protein Imp [Roseibacterium elongatum DSM 19469]